MPVKHRREKSVEKYTHLALKVESHEVRTSASVNNYVYGPQYARDLDDRDPLYEFTIDLTITAIATWPKARAGDKYELTIYGDDAPSRRHNNTLKDAQERDEYGSPKYREYRGRRIPIFNPPKGIGYLNKVRGQPRWTAWLFVPTSFAANMLAILDRDRDLFLSIHERKEGRARWAQGISLQTTDPAEE